MFGHFSGKARKIPKAPKLNTTNRRQQSTSLRSKLHRRYNPPPKTMKSPSSRSPIPSNVASILANSEFKNRKQMKPSTSKNPRAVFSDSDSSDDEGLVNPNEIDYNSKFFDVNKDNENGEAAPVFDCNAGMNLSDSSGDEDLEDVPNDEEMSEENKKTASIINKINKKSSNEVHDFKNLREFAQNLETAKAHLAKLKNKETTAHKLNDDMDVTQLLSMGESASAAPSQKRKRKDDAQSDDSDWENVSGKDKIRKTIK